MQIEIMSLNELKSLYDSLEKFQSGLTADDPYHSEINKIKLLISYNVLHQIKDKYWNYINDKENENEAVKELERILG